MGGSNEFTGIKGLKLSLGRANAMSICHIHDIITAINTIIRMKLYKMLVHPIPHSPSFWGWAALLLNVS